METSHFRGQSNIWPLVGRGALRELGELSMRKKRSGGPFLAWRFRAMLGIDLRN